MTSSSVHGMSPAEYTTRHDGHAFKDKVLHACKICKMDVLYVRSIMANHMSRSHQLSLNEYINMHLSDSPTKSKPMESSLESVQQKTLDEEFMAQREERGPTIKQGS